jgi:hypothetical protein
MFPITWYGSYYLKFTDLAELKMYMINHGFRYLVADNSAARNVPGLDAFWSREKEFPATTFDRLLTDSSGVVVWKIEADYFDKNKLSTMDDWNAFLNSNPLGQSDTTYYQRVREPYFHLIHQKDGPWEGLEWYKDNLFPAWVRYKTEHSLF